VGAGAQRKEQRRGPRGKEVLQSGKTQNGGKKTVSARGQAKNTDTFDGRKRRAFEARGEIRVREKKAYLTNKGKRKLAGAREKKEIGTTGGPAG